MYHISKGLALVGFLALLYTCKGSPANDDSVNKFRSIDEEFVHFSRKADQTKRAHLIWNLERDGARLQVDEFLDLNSWSQLIQFKWVAGRCRDGRLYDYKANVLLTNSEGKPKLVRYEPFKCDVQEFEDAKQNTTSWSKLVEESKSPKDCKSEHLKYLKIIESVVSPLSGSPYVTRFHTNSDKEIWVAGASGLWMRGQHSGHLPQHQIHLKNGGKVVDSSAWRLELPESGTLLLYYFNGNFLRDSRIVDLKESIARSNTDYETLDQVEVRDAKSTQTVDLVNILRSDFDFRDELLKTLFKLPIGFQCPPDLSIPTNNGFYLENLLDTTSLKLELEFVATKLEGLTPATLYSSTDIKSVTVAKSGHPLNYTLPLTMFHLHDDQIKTVRDFNARLRYNMGRNLCEINRLHVMENNEKRSSEAIDLIELNFHNGITLALSEVNLDYLISPRDRNNMRPLNKIQLSNNKAEFVFEEAVMDEAHENILRITDSSHLFTLHKLSVVRVYERTKPSSIKLGGVLRLKRVILLIFDYGRQVQLGQVRINLVKNERPISMTTRASLFDVSGCYNLERESVQMIATYPADPALMDYADKNGQQMIEEFYKSSLDWRLAANVGPLSPKLEKFLLGSSLNYLRIPKVELRSSLSGDELELTLTLLERPSPIHLFDQLDERTFHLDQSERMLVGTPEACSAFCLQLNCMAFAHNSRTHECKLSPDKLDIKWPDGVSADSRIVIARQPFSRIYYASNNQYSQFREASLAELHSYLEHSAAELEENEESETDSGRIKREISVNKWPLMTFSYADKSDTTKEYGPPQIRFVVPSRISFTRVPLTWDVSGENELKKTVQAFRPYQSNMRFMLNLLDSKLSPDEQEPMERTFISKVKSAYYSFKTLNNLDLESCVLMCYNTEDWASKTSAEQICEAFSYCEFKGRCTLAIKTDFNYTKSVLDLANEGETLLEIQSTDDLLKSNYGCYVNKRSYLSGFEGPIRLAPNFDRSKLGDDEFDYRIDHEWLEAIKADSSLPDDVDKQDDCARACKTRNKFKMCLAMEYCTKRSSKPADMDNIDSTSYNYESSCNLLLIKSPEWPNTAKMVEKIESIRTQLVKPSKVKFNTSSTNPSTCNRYLTSHLSLFNQNKRQTRIEGRFAQYLETPAPSRTDINLDRCALECALLQFECKAFEHCSSLDKSTGEILRNCTLYGRARESQEQVDLTEVKSGTTSFSRDCHVYLRHELSSLEDLFSPIDIDRQSALASDINGFFVIMIIFMTVYGSTALLIFFYAWTQKFCCKPMLDNRPTV